jgi:hypothetical protein
MPKKPDGSQRFVVGEYATTSKFRLRSWVETLAQRGARASVFDFGLRHDLNRLANGSSTDFNMTSLNHAGLVQDNTGNKLPGANVVTFAENHDTSRPNYWVFKDWQLPYSYILFRKVVPVSFTHIFLAPDCIRKMWSYTRRSPTAGFAQTYKHPPPAARSDTVV